MTRFKPMSHFSKPALFLALILTLGLSLTVVIGQARSAEPAGLLPNLVSDPPTEEHLETSVTEGGLKADGVPRDLLRFTGYVHNAGPGALDIQGSREKPAETKATEEEVESHRVKEEELPQSVEEELATPPMKVFQRVFTTSAEETNIERPHKEEPSPAEVVYVNADGHHHFHLQRVARYSLWNASRTAEVAPAQKVGFCLEDSEHEEMGIGPKNQVYADQVAPFRDFCQQYRPNATSLFEGISAGWRDRYEAGLGFQWVEVSHVLPGEYWLREDVNPEGVIKETGGANVPAYAKEPTIIPGFIAQPQAVSVQPGESKTITVTSKAFERPNEETHKPEALGPPQYALESEPQHGTLTGVPPNQVIYTPNPGYTGPDSFSFTAGAAGSEFPLNPAIATVSIQVGAAAEPPPSEPPPSEPPPSEPPPGEAPPGALLLGDPTATYPVAEGTPAGHEEAFQFTAKSTGTVEELQFHTNGTANAGITGVDLGIFAEGANKPGKVLGQARASGEPATSSWIKAAGLSVHVVSGTKYWLLALPLGSNELHFNTAKGSGGTISGEALPGVLLSELTEEGNWKAFNQGPVGFQALAARPGVSIEGAPASMIAGTSISLNGVVRNDSSPVIWEASGGSITSGGVYTAPSAAGGTVTITARLSDDRTVGEQRSITILPVPPPVAAIAVPLPGSGPASGPTSPSSTGHGSTLGTHASVAPAVARPQVMLDGRTLIMTTRLGKAGRARLSAYIGHRRIGTCAVETQAGHNFTCRVKLGARVSLHTPISVWASLRIGKQILQVLRPAAPVPRMKMPGMSSASKSSVAALAAQFICSPSMVAAMDRALTPAQTTKLLPALLSH
jgi:hypothetical protein